MHTKGPQTAETPNMAPLRDWNRGRFSGGDIREMMMRYPDCTAEAPTPEMARPMMKATEFGAVAQIREPTSNSSNADKNTNLPEYLEKSLPEGSWNAQLGRRYADPYLY